MFPKYETFSVYLSSTSTIKKTAVYESLKNVFRSCNKTVVTDIKDIDIEADTDIQYVLLIIKTDKIQTAVRSEPASGKETITGAKLRAYSMVKKYPGNWCIGIETGMIKMSDYYSKVDVSKGTIPHEMEDNPEALTYVNKLDRKSTRLNSSHSQQSRMPSSA